jgi:hypothetical protein
MLYIHIRTHLDADPCDRTSQEAALENDAGEGRHEE